MIGIRARVCLYLRMKKKTPNESMNANRSEGWKKSREANTWVLSFQLFEYKRNKRFLKSTEYDQRMIREAQKSVNCG